MAKVNESLSFKKLDQESIVIELRYPFAYLFWDRAGMIFDDIKHRLPGGTFELTNASPGKVSILFNRIYEITVETQQFSVGCSGHPLDVKNFLRVATTVYDTLAESLAFEVYNRIGLRQVFVKRYPTLTKASEALSELPAIAMLVKPLEGNPDATISPSAGVRIEEDSWGTLFSIKAAERDFTVNMPPIFWDSLEESKRTVNLHHALLMFDIDAYTKKDVSIDQFDLVEWTKQRMESVRKSAEMFF